MLSYLAKPSVKSNNEKEMYKERYNILDKAMTMITHVFAIMYLCVLNK